MTSRPSLTIAALLALVVATGGGAGCKYDPHPKDGSLRCSPAGECPDGYNCLASGFCWSNTSSAVTTVAGCNGRTFAVNAQVVRSCVLLVGCSPSDPIRSISECVTLNSQNAAPATRCNLTSSTCADFQKCEGYGIAGDNLCSTQTGGRCVGTRAVNCGNGSNVPNFIDCAVAGGTCQTLVTATNTVVADCRVVSCTDTDDARHCSGNYSYTCSGGSGYGVSCGKPAQGYCYPGDGSCYLLGSGTCSGDTDTCNGPVREVCSPSGIPGTPDLFRFDCASVGLGCGADPATGGSWCLAPGCTKSDYDSQACAESCNGTQLTLCYGGVPYTVDCRNYGFSTCQEFSSSTNPNLTDYATCWN